MSNPYCEALKIAVPVLETVRDHREANTYALMIVALLEHGGPMTLPEVAARLEAAGVALADEILPSLKRCRPARAPIYRDGDHYALDPHDHELDLWAFRLGLRPAKGTRPPPVAVPPTPRPGPDERLTVADLDAVCRDANLWSWSPQRLALAVLDACGPMTPAAMVDFVAARTKWHRMSADRRTTPRRGAPLTVRDDGKWEIIPGAPELASARAAVRDLLVRVRQRAALRYDPETYAANRRAAEERRAAHATELAVLRRVIVHAFPAKHPQAVVLVDVAAHELHTYVGAEVAAARERVATYDVIAAVDVRGVLRALGVDPGARRLAELGPPQKSVRLNRAGRTLAITPLLLVQGSCGISRPFGAADRLHDYLVSGQDGKLRRRLEADAKALYALHEYGRLHGAVRLRWGFLDEMFPAPWQHRDEPTLHHLLRQARTLGARVEAVIGSAPGWEDPWARVEPFRVEQGAREYDVVMVGDDGYVVDDRDVQRARLATTIH